MKKRILSMLLAMIMVAGIVPFSAIPTIAATETSYEVSTWGELENVLTWDSGTTPITITLTADIYEETPNVDSDKDRGDEKYDPIPTVQIVGNKTLDLNGHKIEVNDKSNYYTATYLNHCGESRASENTLFNVTADATLTINDATGKGNITFTGHMLSEWAVYEHYCVRDIFSVEGTLTLNGGTIEAGRSKKQWFTNEPLDPTGLSYSWYSDRFDIEGYEDTHTGYAYQQIWGSAVTMKGKGTFIMNGGTLYGRGSGQYIDFKTARENKDLYSSFTTIRDEVIQFNDQTAKVYINNGNVYAKGGANIFGGNRLSGSLVIKYGIFETDTVGYIRSHEIYPVREGAVNDNATGIINYGELITTGTEGVMNVYEAEWKKDLDNVIVTINGTAYTTLEEKQALELHDVSGTVILAPVAEDGFALEYVSQNPMMPVGYDTWSLYQEYGKTTTFTFNHIPLTAKQVKDGYYVERNYVIRNAANKQAVASGSGILGTDVVNVTHTWNEVGTFTFIEDLTLKDKTGAKVKSKANTFNIYVQPAVDRIEITTPPTQTTYISQIYKTNGYSLPGFYGEGMVVTAYYTDGTTEDVTKYVDFNRTLAIDATQNAISYTDPIFKEEHFAFQPVTVEKAYQISTTDKGGAAYVGEKMYYATEGTKLDLFNTKSYDTTRYQLDGWTVTRDDNGEAVEVHEYINGGSYYFIMPDATVTIEPNWNLKKVVESIQIQTPPTKTSYYEGEIFNISGMKLRVFYTDSTFEDISGDALKPYLHFNEKIHTGIDGYLKTTDTTVYVRYNGFTVTQPISVTESQDIYHVEFTLEGYGYGKNVADAKVTIDTEHISFTTITTTTNYSFWRADLTDNAQVTSGTFGRHEYDISVAITCDTGYIKSFTKDTVTLNGIKAYSLRSISGGKYLISFALPTFIVETIDVTATNISAGNKPNDMKVTVPVGEHYQLTGVKSWEIKNGENYVVISGNEKLQAGKTYRVMMNFGTTDNYLFASGISTAPLKVNGEYVSREYDYSTETVTLIYEFTIPESPKATLISNVTSFADGEEKITVELFKTGSSTPAYSATVTGTVDVLALVVITNIEDGTYTMKVTKANHEVYTATVTAAGEAIYKDVTLKEIPAFLKGDVTGDGAVDSTDYLRIKGHFLGTYTITGIALKAGDVTSDGVIDSTDYLRIKGHFLGTYNLHA